MARTGLRRLILGVALACALAASALAQDNTGQVSGQVRDALDRPVAGARLRLEDVAGAVAGQATSDAEGRYVFRGIAVGVYSLIAERTDFQTATTVVSVRAGTVATANLSMAAVRNLNLSVIAKQLDEARNGLSPDVGASVYHFDEKTIEALPQGPNTSLNQMLLQAPGVAQDSVASGALHIRGEHANVQYRLNGLAIPEGISGFAQNIDTRIVSEAKLITGALPAQYGFRTAGIVDITLKDGAFANGGAVSLYGGSHATVQPSANYAGSVGTFSYFASGSFRETGLGIENPTSATNAIHDKLDEYKGFGYFSYLFPNLSSRASLIVGESDSYFQIPNNPGQTPSNSLTSGATVDSRNLNQRQVEHNKFGIMAYQGSKGDVDYQVAYFSRYSQLRYYPDPIGDLLFNGVAPDLSRTAFTNGVQADATYHLSDAHSVRSGFFVSRETTTQQNTAGVFTGDAGVQTTSPDSPFYLQDNQSITGHLYGMYVQDEWKVTPEWVVNYGARLDEADTFLHESQLSPRLNTTYSLTPSTAMHGGYARTFTPPPLELVQQSSLSLFSGTTAGNTGNGQVNTAPFSERAHVFDAGVSQKITPEIQVGLDAYYKYVRRLLDEGQFGAPVVLTPFNYDRGMIKGVEFSSSYTTEPLSAYFNFAVSQALGKNIISGQSTQAQTDLAYIQSHWIHLDHDQKYSASAGVSYAITDDLHANVSAIYGSGLRRSIVNPNDATLTPYTQIDLGAVQRIHTAGLGDWDFRAVVLNVLDNSYEIRDGTGVGVGAPQFGPRRAYYAGVTKYF